MMTIDELLIDFDEMGFVPTTLCENPDEYAQDWKKQLLVEIARLEKENACLLKACEEQFTFDTTQNKKYSIFDSVRKTFADEVKAKINELLDEYKK